MNLPRLALVLSAAAFAVACSSNSSAPVPSADTEPVPAVSAPRPAEPLASTSVGTELSSSSGFSIGTVYFEENGATVNEAARPVLENAARALIETGMVILIEGHTSQDGSEDYNLSLGERRAEAVRAYLQQLGVPLSQMRVVSYGESAPAMQGDEDAVPQLNRRAEFRPL